MLGGWVAYATLTAFGLAVCLTGYLAMGDYEKSLGVPRDSPAAQPAPASVPNDAAPRPPPPSLAVEPEAPAESAAAQEAFKALLELPAPAPHASPERKPARDAKPASSPVGAMDLPNLEPAPPLVDPAPAAPVAVAPAIAAPEPVVPDRWQLLASALARCERENLFAGVVCRERARLQYCEGEWGNATQCSAGSTGSNTR